MTWLRGVVVWWRWFLFDYPKPGMPLGDGEQRRASRDVLIQRWLAKEPTTSDRGRKPR